LADLRAGRAAGLAEALRFLARTGTAGSAAAEAEAASGLAAAARTDLRATVAVFLGAGC